MSAYTVNGVELNQVYGADAIACQIAYDIDGVPVFTSHPPDLIVMSYNVGSWYDGAGTTMPSDKDAAYYALQNGMLTEHSPDILCIQEYYDTFSPNRTAQSVLQPHFDYIEAHSNGRYYGRAICSKNRQLSEYESAKYTGDANYYYAKAYVTVNDVQIAIYTTHLSTGSGSRATQIQELIALLQEEEYFIACGDFNMLDCNDIHGTDYRTIIQPILTEGFLSANCSKFGFLTTYSDAPIGSYTGCLDNIITSDNIEILYALVDTTKLYDNLEDRTDHMPLIVGLRIK